VRLGAPIDIHPQFDSRRGDGRISNAYTTRGKIGAMASPQEIATAPPELSVPPPRFSLTGFPALHNIKSATLKTLKCCPIRPISLAQRFQTEEPDRLPRLLRLSIQCPTFEQLPRLPRESHAAVAARPDVQNQRRR